MSSGSNTIRFMERKAASPAFRTLYAEGMELVEVTATYLDGQGRKDAKALGRTAATLYAAESMRLTTRLMQVASWLLLQRALGNGEMSREQVAAEKRKIRLDTASATGGLDSWNELPEQFRQLVQQSLGLQARVRRMDADILSGEEPPADPGENPVTAQLNLLKTAFGSL